MSPVCVHSIRHRLIPNSESLTVEFKSDRKRLSDAELVEALVCLANTEGGELWLGVEDDGQATGLHAEQMLLSYIRQHGQIKRAEVMALCRLTEGQAKHLLKRMSDAKQIVMRRQGNLTAYVESL